MNFLIKQDLILNGFITSQKPSEYDITPDEYLDETLLQIGICKVKKGRYEGFVSEFVKHPFLHLKSIANTIMQDLEQRTNCQFKKVDNVYYYKRPAYLVLAAWEYLYATMPTPNQTDVFITKKIMEYLRRCTSFPGLCPALDSAIEDYQATVNQTQRYWPLQALHVPPGRSLYAQTNSSITLPNSTSYSPLYAQSVIINNYNIPYERIFEIPQAMRPFADNLAMECCAADTHADEQQNKSSTQPVSYYIIKENYGPLNGNIQKQSVKLDQPNYSKKVDSL